MKSLYLSAEYEVGIELNMLVLIYIIAKPLFIFISDFE